MNSNSSNDSYVYPADAPIFYSSTTSPCLNLNDYNQRNPHSPMTEPQYKRASQRESARNYAIANKWHTGEPQFRYNKFDGRNYPDPNTVLYPKDYMNAVDVFGPHIANQPMNHQTNDPHARRRYMQTEYATQRDNPLLSRVVQTPGLFSENIGRYLGYFRPSEAQLQGTTTRRSHAGKRRKRTQHNKQKSKSRAKRRTRSKSR